MQRHLVTVWNPAYTTADAMEAHLAILLRAANESKDNQDGAYVWWGKLRSANRAQTILANDQDILAIEAELAGDDGADREVHLYLTDYRSLYVGHVDEIVHEDVTTTEPDRVPAYYRERGYTVDCWFKLLDVRRIVADDLLAVIDELKKESSGPSSTQSVRATSRPPARCSVTCATTSSARTRGSVSSPPRASSSPRPSGCSATTAAMRRSTSPR